MMNDKNTPGGSALRHAATGFLATAVGVWLGKKGVTVGPDANMEIASYVVGGVVLAGTALAGSVGALWRKLIG